MERTFLSTFEEEDEHHVVLHHPLATMQDLEDLGASVRDGLRQPVAQRQVWRHLKAKEESAPDARDVFLPEAFSVWVRTFGCAHNTSDSEYMMGQLQDFGFR